MGTLGKRLPARSPYKISDYIGRRFGTRTVVGQAPEGRLGNWWKVRCDCGREDVVQAAPLCRGRGTTCRDCQKALQSGSGHSGWRGFGAVTATAYAHFKFSAERRGIEWGVTLQQLDAIWSEQGGLCSVSGRPLTMKRGNRHPSNCSLDRIDSALGYLPGNVRWVRKEVNFAKQEMTDEELISLCRDILQTAEAGKFDQPAPSEGLQHIGPTVASVAEDIIERAKGRAA